MINYSLLKKSLEANFKLALPLVGGQLGSVLVMVSDNIMVGQLGISELAAISLGVAIFSIFFVVGYGISQGLPPLVSENFGKGKHHRISKNLSNSLLLNLLFSIGVCVILEMGIPFLDQLGQNPEVVELTIPYLRWSVYSMIPFMLFLAFKSFSDGIGRTSLGMNALIIGNLLNILLNYLFIFGHWGFESMGVSGAGLSSFIARLLMLVIWMLIAFNGKRYRPYLIRLKKSHLSKDQFKLVWSLGSITAIQMLFEVSIFSASTLLMGLIGETPQAAHQVSLNIITVTFMVTSAFAMAGTIEVGNWLGKKNWQEIRYSGFSAIILSMLFMALSAIILMNSRYLLPTLYVQDQSTLMLAAELLVFAAIFQISDGIQVSAISALRGLQDVKWPAFYTFLSYMVCGLPAAYLLAFEAGLGPQGIWIGLIIGLSTSAFLNSRRFWRLSSGRASLKLDKSLVK